MNMNLNPTVEQLRELIRSADDRKGSHLLWVSRAGEVVLTRLQDPGRPPKFEVTPEMQLCCEPFWRGNGYVGPEAVEDEEWVPKLLGYLKEAWTRARGSAEVVHREPW